MSISEFPKIRCLNIETAAQKGPGDLCRSSIMITALEGIQMPPFVFVPKRRRKQGTLYSAKKAPQVQHGIKQYHISMALEMRTHVARCNISDHYFGTLGFEVYQKSSNVISSFLGMTCFLLGDHNGIPKTTFPCGLWLEKTPGFCVKAEAITTLTLS